jgi:hypothetical protein
MSMGGFNKKIFQILNEFGLQYEFTPSILKRPIENGMWKMDLPKIQDEKWKNPNFRLILHAQDFCNWYNNELCVELFEIEKHYNEEQQTKIIFLHWDHDLRNRYTGVINCVEFPSHSWELVESLKAQHSKWKSVYTKSKKKYNFLCLNGYPRRHRNQVWHLLKNENNGFVTHRTHNDYTKAPYAKYDFDNVANFIKLKSLYKSASVSIVTESIYSDGPGIITEKTLLAIAAKHPFMCVGHQHIHREIAERGFENYDEIFDLDYDLIESEYRLDAAIQMNLETITSNDFDVAVAKEKAERNYDFLMNDYMQSIEDRAREQLREIIR